MEYLPNKVRVVHHIVKLVPHSHHDAANIGRAFINDLEIAVSEKSPKAVQLQTLWHEIGHFYQYEMNWRGEKDEYDEVFCDRLSVIVMQILRDNPCILQLHADLLEESVDDLPDDEEDPEIENDTE